ncbi:hypothetical protein DFH09DRAFT_1472566 [Mycena vulgaris]|nr:hypothetical protein DFH09DRAFT_1472566 [Mycena vulgaris]
MSNTSTPRTSVSSVSASDAGSSDTSLTTHTIFTVTLPHDTTVSASPDPSAPPANFFRRRVVITEAQERNPPRLPQQLRGKGSIESSASTAESLPWEMKAPTHITTPARPVIFTIALPHDTAVVSALPTHSKPHIFRRRVILTQAQAKAADAAPSAVHQAVALSRIRAGPTPQALCATRQPRTLRGLGDENSGGMGASGRRTIKQAKTSLVLACRSTSRVAF